jgi:hypothetical protein
MPSWSTNGSRWADTGEPNRRSENQQTIVTTTRRRMTEPQHVDRRTFEAELLEIS